jgi:Uma2 family endonuclease
VELGAFEDERIELLRGLLVEMSPQHPLHAGVVGKLSELLVLALVGKAHVRVQLPFALSDDSEPETDIAVVPVADYTIDHPHTAFLIIEVAQSSLRKDRFIKAALYAEAGIPEYWIVDVVGRAVEVHGHPAGGGYVDVRRVERIQTLALGAFPDVRLKLVDFLPA